MTDVLHFGAEVFVAKSCQLLNQLFRLFTRKGTGKEDAVNQHPQFRILKLARHKADTALHGNLIPHFSQEHKIILNRLPRTWNAIVFFEQIHDFHLRQRMVAVCILLQDLQNQHI